jgi:superfamily II DNA helicase RecQ
MFPSYLKVVQEWRVVLCTTHGSCYTRQNLSRHLRDKHRLKSSQRRIIEAHSQLDNVAATIGDVVQPPDGTDEIDGLPTVLGHLCHFEQCNFRTTSMDYMRQHYNQQHQWQVSRQGAMPWHQAYLQTLFNQKQSQQYFAVVLTDRVQRSGTPQYIYPHANAPDNAPPSTRDHSPSPIPDNAWDQIMVRYRQSQSQPQRNQVETARHVSEITPWMKRTGIYVHLQGLNLSDLGPSYQLPKPDEEQNLYLICESARRVLENTMMVLVHDQNLEARHLSRRNARLLNTFTRGEASQDPITDLQNQQSRRKYSETWQRLICYWDRVVEQGHLRDTLFQPSERQLEAWVEVTEAASELANLIDVEQEDDGEEALRDRLDQAVLEFSLAIIQHLVPRRKFDSVLVSYAAVRYWSSTQGTWMMVGNYTSILSQLIYDCQMVVLAQVLAETADRPDADVGAMIVDIRDRWLLNDTEGPVAELLENRLLGFRIGQTEVPPAQLRWHADGETLVWSAVTFHLSDLHNIIFKGVKEAQRIFEEDLCLSGRSSPASEIPVLDLGLLVDNWDATAPGQSFLTDSRNASYFGPLEDWLISRVGKTPVLFHMFWLQTAEGRWVVSADAAQQYEDAVQKFLQALMVPFFLGSGQQGRRSEFLGLRWRNTTLTTRDLFLHDGQMLFILSYHKTRSQTNASRWPVRFLLPEVAQLVTQYLAIIQPFREFLQQETQIPVAISDYLWSRGTGPWVDDAMTRVVVDTGKLILGKHIHVRAWRQITIGIARRKFAAAEANLLIEEGEGVDDEDPDSVMGSMSAALHWQASHTPHTGNRVYGGTVNFRAGLTDAGLQEYRHVSQLWHRLVRDPLHFEPAVGTPHRMFPQWATPSTIQRAGPRTVWEWDESPASVTRSVETASVATPSKRRGSEVQEAPIARRMARRDAPARTRRRWRMEQATEVLQRMYGPDARYRSDGQEQAMQHIVAGAGQVLAILRTSEGKSLLYLLPCQLPGAGTTVVILPLVVLKDEMQRRSAEAGIAAHVWEAQSDPDRLYSCPLIMVAVEQAVRPTFRDFLNRLHMANQLDRVVFDECHLVVTAVSYRKVMGLLPQLRDLACQMVFLTGTLPPFMVVEFERAMLLRGARMVRSPTTRRDIYLRVSRCPPHHDLVRDFAIPGIQESIAQLQPGTRCIIYCWKKAVAEQIAEAIGSPVYHSESGSAEEKAGALQHWRDGQPAWIVATSAFGLGIDHPAVRLVVHVGVPWSLIDFAQEVGRLGRDGAGGQSVLLVPPQWKPTMTNREGRPLGPAEAAMQTYITTTTCRVLELSRFLDDDARPCGPGALFCDRCIQAGEVCVPEPPTAASSASSASNEEVEGEADDLADLRAGGEELRRKVQTQARQLADYIASLRAWRGICMICYHLPRAGSGQESHARHLLMACPHPRRFEFFDAKKQAQKQGQERGGWFQPFSSCYRCFNPQVVCDQQGQGRCEFADVVMPICWAVYQKRSWVRQYLGDLGGGHVVDDEAAYMLWLGLDQSVHGEAASNAMLVADFVLQQMDADQRALPN